jgi:hypothetical protein
MRPLCMYNLNGGAGLIPAGGRQLFAVILIVSMEDDPAADKCRIIALMFLQGTSLQPHRV